MATPTRTRRVDPTATRPVLLRRNGVVMEVETPVVESRFIPNFREPSTDAPGLVLTDDGTVYLVATDGSRTPLDGGTGLPDWVEVDPFSQHDIFIDALDQGGGEWTGGWWVSTDQGDTNIVGFGISAGLEVFPPDTFAGNLIDSGFDGSTFAVGRHGNVSIQSADPADSNVLFVQSNPAAQSGNTDVASFYTGDGDGRLAVAWYGGIRVGTLAGHIAIEVDGAGDVAMFAHDLPIQALADPTNPQDAATKAYVDSVVGAEGSAVYVQVTGVQTIPSGSGANLPLQLAKGAGLLDFSDPTAPTFILPGTYAVSVWVRDQTGSQAGELASCFLGINEDSPDFGLVPFNLQLGIGPGYSEGATLIWPSPAGGSLKINVFNTAPLDNDFYAGMTITRISGA